MKPLASCDHIYQPLLSDDKETLKPHPTSKVGGYITRQFPVPLWCLWVLSIIQIVLVFSLVYSLSRIHQNECPHPNPQILYSPVQDVVEYKVVKFHSGLLGGEEPDIYSLPPSPKVDAAWESLYNFGISQITEEQAEQLANSTSKAPHSKSEYIVGIDVFHQLHCLNMIRKSLHRDYYPPGDNNVTREGVHLAHCLNSVRQSLQCSADISTIIWRKKEGEVGDYVPRFDIAHSCRDFDKIREWGLNHRTNVFVDG